MLRPEFESIGDVQELHHVRRELAPAIERLTDLPADRRVVFGKRQGLHAPAVLLAARAQSAAPAFPSRSDPGLQTQSASHVPLQHVVDRLSAPDELPGAVVHQHFGGHRTPIVVRRHHRAIGARVADREQIADFERRQRRDRARAYRTFRTRDRRRPRESARRRAAPPLRCRATRRTARDATGPSCPRRRRRTTRRRGRASDRRPRVTSTPAGPTIHRPGSSDELQPGAGDRAGSEAARSPRRDDRLSRFGTRSRVRRRHRRARRGCPRPPGCAPG